MVKRNILSVFLLLTVYTLLAQTTVSRQKMQEVYDKVRTPYKYGLALAPETNNYKMDCPTVFQKGNKWYMTFVIYNGSGGKDGRGYETWLAESDNLLEWNIKGRLLSFREGTWDTNQRGGFPALPDMEWGGSYALQPYKGNYWMTYIGGANPGYETGPLRIGLAWTKEQNLGKAVEWNSKDKPILSSKDKDAQWFENLTQYKSTIYWDKKETLGYPFVMFYNAGGRSPETRLKGERIGIALSKDLKKWKRYSGNPVFSHETQGTITGDASIQRMGDLYVMFYFSAFVPSRTYKAFNTFACSYDLVHWTDWDGEDLIIPSKDYDNLFAHKSSVIYHNQVVYHFYCAVNKYNQRGIAVATSKPMGRSAVHFPQPEVKGVRKVIDLDKDWQTALLPSLDWKKVNLPHNWDDYYGYRQLTHGNLHGTALYTKTFEAPRFDVSKRYFLYFEGVGTYATVVLNGKDFGRHPVGRTTLTLDVTDAIKPGKENQLEVKAEHPEMISDMPWVCGGCSSEWGFSEGSQPLGIFRPMELMVTDEVRIEPFGVHIWNDDRAKTVYVETEIRNYGPHAASIQLVNKLNDADGLKVFRLVKDVTLAPGETKVIRQSAEVEHPSLWSIETPYLYSLASMIKRNNKTADEVTVPFGIRTLSWPVKRNDGDGRFYLNDKPLFINGVCEYEHLFGQSHAFSREQVASRVKQIKAAGFNAFRDAHQPHNLEYQRLLDEDGLLCWSQFSAHIWYDTPEFRANFKQLLRQWIKERRNSPSVVMWGLQNESVLPRDFAKECSDIIREMDPTARGMRVITTCNGGEGTDWNVVQNWSGTYGGKPENYAHELAQPDQLLNGEYGAWRSIGLHTEPGVFQQNGVWSEDRMCRLLEMKIRQAEQVRDSVCGQFLWVFSSHDNSGRRQPDEGYRKIDKVGPFNYKGLVTPWEEPLDAYYLYRSTYVPASKDPMVYLVSHTWPDRFLSGRRRGTIEVYSNCDSVKLYNDAAGYVSLGTKKRYGIAEPFTWENRDIHYDVLRAVGYYRGKAMAEDVLVLNGLEHAPHFEALYRDATSLLQAQKGYDYLYRVNCGGDAYTDQFGQLWSQDNIALSHSWGQDFPGLNPYLGSQRSTNDPIKGTRDWPLFQHFRFGRHRLYYHFSVPDGEYRVELYFVEPWHGTGGSEKTDCEGLRIFDVAVNDRTVLDDLDIWAEAGHDGALKKVVTAKVTGGILKISFPEVKAGEALISAIAIARKTSEQTTPLTLKAAEQSKSGIDDVNSGTPVLTQEEAKWTTSWSWAKADQDTLAKTPVDLLPEDKDERATVTYEAEQATVHGNYKKVEVRKQTGICLMKGTGNSLSWKISTGLAQVYALRFKYMNTSGKPLSIRIQLISADGTILKDDQLLFPETPPKWKMVSTTTGSYINAGHYTVKLSGTDMNGLCLDALDVQ